MARMDRLYSVLGVLVAVIAVAVSIKQGVDSRRHNTLSVMPFLAARPALEGEGKNNGLYLGNAGLGPAIINKATLSVDGKAYDFTRNAWSEVFKNTELQSLCFATSWLAEGSALSAGEEVALISVTKADLPLCYFETLMLITQHTLKIDIHYASMYGEARQLSKVISLSEDDINATGIFSGLSHD